MWFAICKMTRALFRARSVGDRAGWRRGGPCTVQAFRSSSPRWPIAVMACVLLVVACRTESDDAIEGSQTNDKKQGATKTKSVPVPTSKHASEEEPVQADDHAVVHDVIVAAKDEDSAAADAGTIKGVAKWNDAPFKQRPIPGVEGADPHSSTRGNCTSDES